MAIKRHNPHACDAWQLLVKFSFTQNTQVSPLAAELDLSPAQCHVLRLLEPDKPIPMRQLADGLCCDASNVTGLVDRLESKGLVRRDRVGRGSARQGDRADAEGRAPARRVHGAHGRPARRPRAPQRPRAADAGPDPGPPARVASPAALPEGLTGIPVRDELDGRSLDSCQGGSRPRYGATLWIRPPATWARASSHSGCPRCAPSSIT